MAKSQAAPVSSGKPALPAGPAARLLDRLVGRAPDIRSISVVMLLGVVALCIGLAGVSGSDKWGFTWGGALDGILSVAQTTVPAGGLISAATALNVLVGAIVLRFLGTPPFRTLSELIVAGFAAAVVLDTAALFLLGGFGYFGWPELLVAQVAVVAAWLAVRRTHPLLACRLSFRPRRPAAWWLLVAAVWSGPLIVQLASPAAPFFDVLPNHVAPVEHVRTFGSFETLTTSPSPIYGPSRLLLGYVGLLGELATLTGIQGVLATAAFALPLAVIMAVSMRQLASRLFGAGAGYWILLTFPLTFAFMRLPDTRGTVVALPLAACALGSVVGHLRAGRRAEPESSPGPDWPLAAALGGSILLHPLMGLVTATAAAGMLLLEPRRLAPHLVPALGAAALIGAPQIGTMLGLGAPAQLGLTWLALAVPVALALSFVTGRTVAPLFERLRLPPGFPGALQAALLLAVIAAALLVARATIAEPDDPASYLTTHFRRISVATVVGAALGLGVCRRGWVVLGAGIAAGLAAWATSGLVGRESLTEQAIHYEVPKAIQYWLPVMLALGAAGAVAAVWRLRRLGPVRALALAAFVLVIVTPYPGPIISNIQIGEHRAAESLGLAVREAELGYWQNFPDSRLIVNAGQREVIDRLRVEIADGRLGPSTQVLHVAATFQQWASVPIGVFTGALETSISLEPELSIHTEGGRLLGFDSLAAELEAGYGYVVLEPSGLDPSLADQIAAAGYRLIWVNSTAQIYARNA